MEHLDLFYKCTFPHKAEIRAGAFSFPVLVLYACAACLHLAGSTKTHFYGSILDPSRSCSPMHEVSESKMRLKETRKRRMMYTRIKQPINR